MKSLRFAVAVLGLCPLLVFLLSAQSGQAKQKLPAGFAAAVDYSSGGRGAIVTAVADFNGDGKLDIAVADEFTNSVGVLLGNGDGTFQSPLTYGSGGGQPLSIAASDVNRDGIPDIIVTDASVNGSGDSEVNLLLGNGDGTFQSPVSYDSGGYYPNSVAVADLNGDGFPDLVVADQCPSSGCNPNGVVAVLLGNGNGTFKPAVSYDSGAVSAWSVAVGDVNNDGIPDLVVANQGTCATCATSAVGVLLGNGNGTFKPAVIYTSGPAESFSVAIGDLNGDGHPDLVVSTNCFEGGTCGGGGVNVLIGNGNGSFQAPVTYHSGGGGPSSVVMADVNGDGFLDVVAAQCGLNSCSAVGEVGVLLGTGSGTLQTAVNYPTGESYSTSVVVADLNADGKLDLIAGNQSANVGVLLNNAVPVKTTTTVVSSPNPSLINQSVTFTATLTSNTSVPDGSTITFFHGKSAIGTGTTTKGVASFTTSFPKPYTYSIRANYAGDVFHKASAGVVKQLVNR